MSELVFAGGVTSWWVNKKRFCQDSANFTHIIKFPENWQKIQPFHPVQGRKVCQFSEIGLLFARSHPPKWQRTVIYLDFFRKLAEFLPHIWRRERFFGLI
jgi:hypothetical protein